ncbi:hypothetical protein SRHO_G00341330 [Serrasalmus rhombeus]
MEPDELFDDPVHDDDDDDAAPVDAKNNTGKEDTPQQNPESQQHDEGENTFDEPHRRTALSPSRYFNARLFSADNRFARDTNYIFFAQFVTEMHLATSSMSIQLRKAKSMTRDGCRINSALLQDKQELDKLTVGNSHLLLDIQCCRDEMARVIKAQQGETVDFSALDWSEKCEILRSNPVTAMRMFEKRVEDAPEFENDMDQDDSAVRMSLPMKCLQDKDPDDENVWMTGLAEKYMARPNTPEFENMCMAEFASEYRIVYAGQRKGTETLQRVYTIVNENREKYEKHSEAIEQAIENFEQNGPIEDAWTDLAPANELIRLECMMEQEPTDPTDVTEQDDVPDYAASKSENRTAMPVMEAPQMSSAEIRKMYQSLNETQAAVFYSMCDWCKRKVLNENPQQFFYYVAGTAGTGKSHLIKSVYAQVTKILQKLPCVSEEVDISKATVLMTAFTGCASQYCNVQIMIIDEISMVSKPLFAYVNRRLLVTSINYHH